MTTGIMARCNSRSRCGELFPKTPTFKFLKTGAEERAYDTIIRLLDANHDGVLSSEEKARARIILYGHSWGASAAVLLARDLRRQGVPVLLTVQVDSVAKVWQERFRHSRQCRRGGELLSAAWLRPRPGSDHGCRSGKD